MLRSAALVDSGETASLRRKLLAVAQSQIDPLPTLPLNWQVVLAPPFTESNGELEALRSQNAASTAELQEKLKALTTQGEPNNAGGES
jgi:hypothetical protein